MEISKNVDVNGHVISVWLMPFRPLVKNGAQIYADAAFSVITQLLKTTYFNVGPVYDAAILFLGWGSFQSVVCPLFLYCCFRKSCETF